MNLNSIQQQPKKKKAVDTAAERVLVPLWGAFSKKKKNRQVEKPVLWDKRPRPFLWETAARKPSGHGQDESSQDESESIQPSNQKELPTIREIFFNCASTAFAYPELTWIILLFDIYIKITFDITVASS